MRMERKGLALILVVGVLGVLAVLGSAFAVLSRLERRAALQRVMGTKTLLLARSGMEDAQARVDAGQVPDYGGEDLNDDRILNAGPETDNQGFQTAVLNRADCPVAQALRPSFFKAAAGTPRMIGEAGRMRGYSGGFGREGATWSLKVVPDGGFPVNGGDTQFGIVGRNLNFHLKRLFGNLAEAIDQEDGLDDGLPLDQVDGENLILLRPVTARGWESFEQIRDVALGGSQSKLDALKDYLELRPWTDLKVTTSIDLSPLSQGDRPYHMARDWRTGRWPRAEFGYLWPQSNTTRYSPDLQRGLRASALPGGKRVVGRAPVDLAWARTKRPALLALLGNLQGIYARRYLVGEPAGLNNYFLVMRWATITLDWTQPTDDCRIAADALLSTTSELSTWEAFHDFCDALPLTGDSDLAQGMKDLIKANFNPNTDTNKLSPEPSLRRTVDKSDVVDHSLEFNLAPRNAWRITCVGRLLASGARSERVLSARTRPDLLFKLTSQGEFLAESLGSPEGVGDEAAFRGIADPRCATPSAGTNATFGHQRSDAPPSPFLGVSLQTYPEPYAVCVAGLPAFYDGQLKLATVERRDGEYAGGGSTRLLARYDDAFEADLAGNSALRAAIPGLAPPESPLWPSKANAAATPGALYPNGTYGEINLDMLPDYSGDVSYGSSFAYHASPNLDVTRGAISFWLKPACDRPADGSVYRMDERYLKLIPDVNAFLCDIHRTVGNGNYDFHVRNWGGTGPVNDGIWDNEQAVELPVPRPWLSRWYLCTYFWDLGGPLRSSSPGPDDPTMKVFIDRGVDYLDHNTPWNLASMRDPSTRLGGIGSNIVPGALWLSDGEYASPCATLDEFAIYDLGSSDDDRAPALAQDTFEAGRYYKESDYPESGGLTFPLGPGRTAGEWFSAPVDLGPVRLRNLSWTQIVPPGLKALPVVPAGTPKEDYDDGEDGRIVLELAHKDVQVPAAPGADYAVDAQGRRIETLFQDSRGNRLERPMNAPFRLHAVFQPRLEDPDGKAILDPLALDDVTVTYRPLGQSALSSWRDRE